MAEQDSFDLRGALAEHQATMATLVNLEPQLQQAVQLLANALEAGHRIFACGNGGSAADAQHFAAELTGRFERDRPGLAAMSLTTDTSALTSISNDYGFDRVFARQLQALCRAGDVLVAISTSGQSPNVVQAVDYARTAGVHTIGLLGRDGGVLAETTEVALVVPVQRTARIQEAHILILHLLCEALEAARP